MNKVNEEKTAVPASTAIPKDSSESADLNWMKAQKERSIYQVGYRDGIDIERERCALIAETYYSCSGQYIAVKIRRGTQPENDRQTTTEENQDALSA